MENSKKLFGIENKKLPSTKEFLLGLFSLVALEVGAQNEAHKHYSTNEINTLKSQAKEMIDQLNVGNDSTVIDGNKLIWEVRQTRKDGNIVKITETRKTGETVIYSDGYEGHTSTNAGDADGYIAKPSNGFPIVEIKGGSAGNDTINTTQGKLERIKGDFSDENFNDQRVFISSGNGSAQVEKSIEFSQDEAKDFVGGYVAQFKGDLAIIKDIQTRK